MTWAEFLPLFFLAVMGLSLLTYGILDGCDLGVVLLLLQANDVEKDTMIASIGPFWDALARSPWPSRWAQTLWTSAKPFTPTPRWAKASAWRRRWRMGLAQMYHRPRSRPVSKLFRQSPNWQRFGLCALLGGSITKNTAHLDSLLTIAFVLQFFWISS